MEKTLRYLMIVFATLGVLSVSAQAHQYSATHYSSHEQSVTGMQINPQMPMATMGNTHSDYMTTGSTLPQAAVDGVTTTEEQESSGGRHGNIRKWGEGGGSGEPGDWEEPYADPIGDAAIPLALLACAYLIIRVARRRAKGGRTA